MGAVRIIDDKLPLDEYFPDPFIIHEYNATENRIVKSTNLNDDIKCWLRDKCNKKFVFQCLLCQQEMTFHTAFWREDYSLNRSHLLTKKHTLKIINTKCVGIFFVSSQKFVICMEKDFSSGNILNVVRTVKRNNESLKQSNLNKVFCENYSMYSFDRAKKSLCELQWDSDIVIFMRDHVRPLFKFHCLICNTSASSYKIVIDHLMSNKHKNKLRGKKPVLVSIKDFNIFISCDFDKITSFIFLEHLNSYLEEIVVASEGSVLITGCHTNNGKAVPKEGGIKIDVSPIKLPNGQTKNISVDVTTRYNKALVESPEKDSITNELAFATSQGQKNVIIYEFSVNDFQEHYIDNILHVSFDGCKIWCSRCCVGLFTLHSLQHHLSSQEHNKKVRGNEQAGFMCHFCKIFFIELKGERFCHVHTSRENKIIISKLGELAHMHSIEYITPINKCVTNVYNSLLRREPEAVKFCCIACFDVTKQKLMYLGYHETSDPHVKQEYSFTYCQDCNVIYIDKRSAHTTFDSFKLHFFMHMNKNKAAINYEIHNTQNESFHSEVNKKSISMKNILVKGLEDPYCCKNLTVWFSINFMQFHHLGVSSRDFVLSEDWDNTDFLKYLETYESVTGDGVILFECKTCNMKTSYKMQMINHLFVNEHQSANPIAKRNFTKICDLCKMMIWSESQRSLQEHFTESIHIDNFSRKTDISSTFLLSINKNSFSWLEELTKGQLKELIDGEIDKIRSTFSNRAILSNDIRSDMMALLSSTFPNVNVKFYGSRISGLALPESDFDLYINLGNEHLEKVADIFRNENRYFKLIVCISNSSVPLIRATHKASGVVCDISLDDKEINTKISRLVRIMTSIDERVLWLLAAVRYWAKCTGLLSSNMFSSHAITWLVLFYLMQPDVRMIPHVGYVIEECGDLADIADDEDCILEWTKNKINYEMTGMDLLEGFFQYYSSLKFSKYKLHSRNGLVTPRNSEVPEEGSPAMILIDPLNNARNILFHATKEKSEKLTAACYLSLHLPWRLDEQ